MKRSKAIIALVFPLLALLFAACGKVQPIVDATRTSVPDKTRIALYSDQGVWDESVQAAENMFRWMGYQVERVDADFINRTGLDGFAILVIPGGDMYQYSQDLSPTGKENIKDFVRAGGGYIGICGGAYFASEKVIWQGNQLPMQPLGLFPGTAEGPIDEIAPYPEYTMAELRNEDPSHPIMHRQADSIWMLYYWGPALIPNTDADVMILARSQMGNKPMMIALQYGSGRVFLVATHPEIEEDDNRDGNDFAEELDDQGSDWELMRDAVLWILGTDSNHVGSE